MALSGDDISALYEAHADSILRFLMRRTFDAHAAMDLLAETFAVAFEQRGGFRGDADANGANWLFAIAANLAKEFFRSGVAERAATRRLGIEPIEMTAEEIERIDALAGTADLRAAVTSALGDLAPDQRDAVRMRVVEELPYPEVARRMSVSEEVARARVSRALRRMRQALDAGRDKKKEVMENV